ncbi:MAG: hypothetical protein U0R50_13130 [Gaiellales bacterium]
MATVVIVIMAVVAVAPILAWIGALIWAGLRDGRDEDEFRRNQPPPSSP